mmetsp:Transcript_64204/g.106349  ORF Transcript_64204/g.106349 Transcript_64204/m.106349 type:complete len:84 (-) Transcript_64204:15-266(-)
MAVQRPAVGCQRSYGNRHAAGNLQHEKPAVQLPHPGDLALGQTSAAHRPPPLFYAEAAGVSRGEQTARAAGTTHTDARAGRAF